MKSDRTIDKILSNITSYRKHRGQKKVLLFLDYSQQGGTRTYAKQLIDYYSESEYLVLIVSAYDGHDKDMEAYCHARGSLLVRYSFLTDKQPKATTNPIVNIKISSELSDLIVAYQPSLIVASVGTAGLFLAHCGRGRPSIYIVHACLTSSRTGWRAVASRTLRSWILPRDILYTTVSKYAANCISTVWGIKRNKIYVIYGTCGSVTQPKKEKNNEKITILSVGSFIGYKNPFLWIESARLICDTVSNVVFKWAGSGPLLSSARDYIRKLGLADKVLLLGNCDKCDFLYEEADIFIHISLFESLGLAVLDAMRHGIPSIVSNIGGLTETIEHNVSGLFVDPSRPQEIAQAITQLTCDQSLRKRMGAEAKDRYNVLFSPECWVSRMDRLSKSCESG